MKRGPKPKPSVNFYMSSQTFGEIKILFSYDGKRYSGGGTWLTVTKTEFDKLKPNGEPKKWNDKNNPKLINGILVHELLRVIKNSLEERLNADLREGKELEEDYVKELISTACDKMFQQLGIWCTNQEWNKRVYAAFSNYNPLKPNKKNGKGKSV